MLLRHAYSSSSPIPDMIAFIITISTHIGTSYMLIYVLKTRNSFHCDYCILLLGSLGTHHPQVRFGDYYNIYSIIKHLLFLEGPALDLLLLVFWLCNPSTPSLRRNGSSSVKRTSVRVGTLEKSLGIQEPGPLSALRILRKPWGAIALAFLKNLFC